MPRMSRSTSSSESLAPSIRVEAPVEVIRTDRLRRPTTCGENLAPAIHCPFNSSICVIFDQTAAAMDEILWSKRFFFGIFHLFQPILSITLTILDYSRSEERRVGKECRS